MVDTVIWQDDTGAWSDATAIFSKAKPVLIDGNNFYVVDEGLDFKDGEGVNAVPVVVSLVRSGLTIYGRDQEGNPKNDPTVIKNIQGIWPEIDAAPGTVIQVYVGFQDTAVAPVLWQGPRDFVVGEDFYLDFIVTGRYIAVRFESSGQPVWVLSAYDLDIERAGGR